MNYDSVILEMLSRIQVLEEEVKKMSDNSNQKIVELTKEEKTITTSDIKKYIDGLINEAKNNGKESIVLIARDIHNELKLKQRYPMVCNAMKQCMKANDEIIFSPKSGYSSTLEIKYKLK